MGRKSKAKGKAPARTPPGSDDEHVERERQTRAAQTALAKPSASSKKAAKARARDEEDDEEEAQEEEEAGEEAEEADDDDDMFEPGVLEGDPEDGDPEEDMLRRLADHKGTFYRSRQQLLTMARS